MKKRTIETIATTDEYWTSGLDLIEEGEASWNDIVQLYADAILQTYDRGEATEANVRKCVEGAKRLDDEARANAGQKLNREVRARTLAHHSIRFAYMNLHHTEKRLYKIYAETSSSGVLQ